MKRLRNWLSYIIIVLIWGLTWTVIKSGLSYVTPLNLVLHRFLLSVAVLSPILIPLRRRIPRDRQTLTRLLVLGVINVLSLSSTTAGLVYEQAGISAVLTYTQPLFVFCLAIPFLREQIDIVRLLGLFTGFSGVVALSLKEANFIENFSYPSILLIIGAFLWAVTIVYYKKFLSQVDPFVANTIQLIVGAFMLGLFNVSFASLSFPFIGAYILIVLYGSILSFGVAYTLWFFLLKQEEATVVSSLSLIVPVVAVFFGWLILKENIEPLQVLGISLVMIGIWLVNKTQTLRSY